LIQWQNTAYSKHDLTQLFLFLPKQIASAFTSDDEDECAIFSHSLTTSQYLSNSSALDTGSSVKFLGREARLDRSRWIADWEGIVIHSPRISPPWPAEKRLPSSLIGRFLVGAVGCAHGWFFSIFLTLFLFLVPLCDSLNTVTTEQAGQFQHLGMMLWIDTTKRKERTRWVKEKEVDQRATLTYRTPLK